MNSPREDGERWLPRPYYERDTRIIPSNFWPAALIDLALSRSMKEHLLLRNTGIFGTDLHQTAHCVCPEQLLQLIQNIKKYSTENDISFLFGHQVWSRNIGSLSEQLVRANNLDELVEVLIEHQSLFFPLLNIRRCYEGNQLVLYWQDACDADDSRIFLVEAMTTAFGSLVRWLAETHLPWSFYFTHKAPPYIEQYQVHLDGGIYFECQHNAMAIAREFCFQPWLKKTIEFDSRAGIGSRPSIPTLSINSDSRRCGFLVEVYNYLGRNINFDPNLEQTAADFGMSSASFKRKLKKHRSHFQAVYDQVRRDLALYWIHQEGWSNEQVARKLHYYDTANFRRAFKKWTGQTLFAARAETNLNL